MKKSYRAKDVSRGRFIPCRCCGKHVSHKASRMGGDLLGISRLFEETFDTIMHDKCGTKHWREHSKGINSSRCKEFKE